MTGLPRTALLLVVALPPAPLAAQDWSKDVELACTHRRYGLRLAAARKVAGAGAAAVPAIRAFQRDKGQASIPVALVEAIATAGHRDEAVVALLEEWARDRDFYWRAQALRGLADRADPRHRELFLQAVQDPAWLTRVQGGRGLDLLGRPEDRPRVLALLDDGDPRVRTRIAAHLLDRGETAGLQVLLAALLDDRSFLGDPWGRRMAQEALRALKTWLGDDAGYDPDASPAANRAAVDRLVAAARDKAPSALPDGWRPQPPPALDLEVDGGIEVLSCRNGDLFLRWTAAGEVVLGLDRPWRSKLPAATWRALRQRLGELPTEPPGGVVVCDKMRLKWTEPTYHAVAAPGALPAAFAAWFEDLARALEEAGGQDAAAALRDRLQQFAAEGGR